jgi:hypothetical protein
MNLARANNANRSDSKANNNNNKTTSESKSKKRRKLDQSGNSISKDDLNDTEEMEAEGIFD